jgi:hypothetical protein
VTSTAFASLNGLSVSRRFIVPMPAEGAVGDLSPPQATVSNSATPHKGARYLIEEFPLHLKGSKTVAAADGAGRASGDAILREVLLTYGVGLPKNYRLHSIRNVSAAHF